MSADQKTYEFKLRDGLKFHNGDPFTAEDVKFSFQRSKVGKVLKDRVRDVEIVSPTRVRFHLHEPFPDFMALYGTMATGAGWIVPKKYVEKVGDDGFRKQPVGLGPYKFVSHTPGVDLVLEAYEGYWRKMPSVKRLVFKSVPEATTRAAMLKNGEVDVAYMLDTPTAQELKRDPQSPAGLLGRDRRALPGLLRPVGSEVPVGRPSRAPGRQPRPRSQGAQRGRDARRLAPDRQHGSAHVRLHPARCRPTSTIPARPRSSWPRPAIRTASTAAISIPTRPTSRPARRSSATSARSASG